MELCFNGVPAASLIIALSYNGEQFSQANGFKFGDGDMNILVQFIGLITEDADAYAGYFVSNHFFLRAQAQFILNFTNFSDNDRYSEIILGVFRAGKVV